MEKGKVKIEKKHMLDEIARHFSESADFFVTNYAGLSVAKLDELRKEIKTAKGDYLVVKNSMARLALEERNLQDAAGLVDGPCGFGFVQGDPIAIAKALVAFGKTNENFKLRGGYLSGSILSQDKIKELASLPSREVLIAKAVGVIKSPLYQMVNVFAGMYKKLVYALEAVSAKKIGGSAVDYGGKNKKSDKKEEVKNG